jgi:hypothetical protein
MLWVWAMMGGTEKMLDKLKNFILKKLKRFEFY